jgi:hypothetical protein
LNAYITIKSFSASGEKYNKVFINSVSASGNQQSYPLIKLKTLLDADSDFTVTVIDDTLLNITREQLLTISNFKHKQLIISNKYTILDAKKILPSSLSSTSFTLNTQVSSVQDIKKYGDYFYDIDSNYLELFDASPEPFIISFIEYNPIFVLSATDINLLSLSNYSKYGLSDNFINMLELVLQERGIGSNGSI